LAPEHVQALKPALGDQDAARIQQALDPHVLFVVNVSPEARVKVARGPAPATLQQGGYTPALIKVINESGVTQLHISSPQALPTSARGKPGQITKKGIKDRFLDVALFTGQPLTDRLSGL